MSVSQSHAERLPVQRRPARNQWLVIRAVSLCGVLGLVLGLFLLAGLELDGRVLRVARIM